MDKSIKWNHKIHFVHNWIKWIKWILCYALYALSFLPLEESFLPEKCWVSGRVWVEITRTQFNLPKLYPSLNRRFRLDWVSSLLHKFFSLLQRVRLLYNVIYEVILGFLNEFFAHHLFRKVKNITFSQYHLFRKFFFGIFSQHHLCFKNKCF